MTRFLSIFGQASTQRVIAIGFVLVLALMIVLIATALSRMTAIKSRMEAIVAEQNVKTESVFLMRNYARERFNSLTQMTVMRDPFERDEEYLRFKNEAVGFIKARDRMLALQLNESEQRVWESAREIIRADEKLHDAVLEMAQAERRDEAIALLLREVRPLELQLVGVLDTLVELQRQAAKKALSEAETEYRQAFITMAALALLAVVLGYFIARLVILRSRHAETELAEQKEIALDAAEKLTWAASHDSLTGLMNRSGFEREFGRLILDARRHGHSHALLYLDLDQFKIVNDTCGHVAGDELLKQMAVLLHRHVRNEDTVARLGGDEFGFLLARCPLSKAREIAEALRSDIEAFRFVWTEKTFQIGASIGVAEIGPETEGMAQVLSAADSACYLAKEKGRNRIWVHQPDDEELLRRRGEMQWPPRLSRALEEGRFELHYQAIVPVATPGQAPEMYEVLVRLRDEEGGLVAPMAFIPAAERYGLMHNLDRWVIKAAIERLRARSDDRAVTYMLNVSAQSMVEDGFLGYVQGLVRASGLDPRRIGFEITETAAIANLSQAIRFIRALRDMGCPVALDDFGSGMASFAYLKNLPVSLVKIDGSFVTHMAKDRLDFTMVDAISRIVKQLGLKVVAEHVEDEETLKLLGEVGVDFAQGFGIHRPEPM